MPPSCTGAYAAKYSRRRVGGLLCVDLGGAHIPQTWRLSPDIGGKIDHVFEPETLKPPLGQGRREPAAPADEACWDRTSAIRLQWHPKRSRWGTSPYPARRWQ